MSNRLTKGKALVGSVQTDSVTGMSVGSSTQTVTSYVKVIPFTAAGTTAEQDSGYDIPTYSKVTDVTVLFGAASTSGGTMSVGLLSSSSGGNATGFASGLSSTGARLIGPTFTTSTSGATGSFAVSNTYGAFLSAFATGSTAVEDDGLAARKVHASGDVTAKSVTWTLNSTGTAVTGNIYIHVTQFTT